MRVRIHGLEVEHGVQTTTLARQRVGTMEFAEVPLNLRTQALRLMLDVTPEDAAVAEVMAASWPRGEGSWITQRQLVNGAYLHWERGDNVEYAGPECTTPTDVVRGDEAGKRILTALVSAVNNKYELDNGFRLIRNNTASLQLDQNATCNSDECFRVPSHVVPELDAGGGGLLPHLVTRQIYTSAGEVLLGPGARGWSLLLSSRARFLDVTRGPGYHGGARAMIKLAADYDRRRWRRIQVACGDTTMSQWSTLLRVGTTSLIVEMLQRPEYRKLFQSLALLDPVAELKEVACDVDLERRAVGKSHLLTMAQPNMARMTALEMQAVLYKAAAKFVARGGGTPDAPLIIDLWGQALTDLETGWDGLTGQADFATKFTIIERLLVKSPDATPAELRREDIRYHTIGARGTQLRLAASGAMPPVVSDIDELITRPPHGTRAEPRSALIRAVAAAGLIPFPTDWDYVESGTRKIRLKDPTFNYAKTVAREVAALQKLRNPGPQLAS